MQIKLTIDRFEGEVAILKTQDNQTINWPKNNLPKTAHEGSVFYFSISEDKKEEEKSKNAAKDMLNEILG